MISAAARVSCVSSIYVAVVCLTGRGGLCSIVVGLFFVVGVIGTAPEPIHDIESNSITCPGSMGQGLESLGHLRTRGIQS